MDKTKKISIRNLEVKELEKVFGGKEPIGPLPSCPSLDVLTDSDAFSCGSGSPDPGPMVPLENCRYPNWVCL